MRPAMRKVVTGVAVPLVAAMGLWLGSASSTAIARPTAAHAVKAVSESTSPDTDSVQQGDQTSPDTSPARALRASATRTVRASAAGSSAAESDGEGSEQSSDGSGGHEDPPGDVNHECTGDCQE